MYKYAISLGYKPPPSFMRVLHTLPKFMFTQECSYKASWSPYIGEELPVQREVNNIHDDFAVGSTWPQEQQYCRSCTTGNFQSLLVLLAQEWQRDDL